MDLLGTLTIATVAAVTVASRGVVSPAAAGLALANVFQVETNECIFFLVKRVLGQGPEQREPNKAVLCLLIIIKLISFIVIYYY